MCDLGDQVDQVGAAIAIKVPRQPGPAVDEISGPGAKLLDVERAVAIRKPGMNVIRIGQMNEITFAVTVEITGEPLTRVDAVAWCRAESSDRESIVARLRDRHGLSRGGN